MKVIIVDKVSLQVKTQYEADAPSQANYGGPWGDATQTVHLELPVAVDAECAIVEFVEATEEVEAHYVVSEDAAKKAAKTASALDAQKRAAYQAAKSFGAKLAEDFAIENIVMGITEDGMTGPVRKAMSEVMSALSTGSLKDAIAEARAIPAEKKDAKYITDARLLAAINKIEAFLGMPISSSL